jgi:ADP-ribosylglycohydrolase
MRISPLAIFGHGMDPAVLMEMAREDAKLTHPNVVCQDANAIFTATAAHAIQSGSKPDETYEYALSLLSRGDISAAVMERLRAASASPPAEFATSKSGWVLVAFQNAFFRLLHAASLEEGIVDTVRCGGDTDTNAAIAGALLGAVHGRHTIPQRWISRILACRPIQGLADVHRPRPAEYWPVDALSLAENLLLVGRSAA